MSKDFDLAKAFARTMGWEEPTEREGKFEFKDFSVFQGDGGVWMADRYETDDGGSYWDPPCGGVYVFAEDKTLGGLLQAVAHVFLGERLRGFFEYYSELHVEGLESEVNEQ